MAKKPQPAGSKLHDIKDPACKQRAGILHSERDSRRFRRESGRTCPVCSPVPVEPPTPEEALVLEIFGAKQDEKPKRRMRRRAVRNG